MRSPAFGFGHVVDAAGGGGTHPALVEAMAFGSCVITHNTAENLETIGDAGLAYDGQVGALDLRKVLQQSITQPELVVEYGKLAQQRAQIHYSWEAVTDAYEKLFYQICRTK